LFNHRNHKAFKEKGKTGPGFSPGDLDLEHAMFGAIDPGNASMQICAKLTGVQMPPNSLLGMIPTRKCLATLRTFPMNSKIMLQPDVYTMLRDVQLYSGNIPGVFKAQYLFIKLGVAHQNPLLGDSYITSPPTENPEEPSNIITG
jgi:hypothetical protein